VCGFLLHRRTRELSQPQEYIASVTSNREGQGSHVSESGPVPKSPTRSAGGSHTLAKDPRGLFDQDASREHRELGFSGFFASGLGAASQQNEREVVIENDIRDGINAEVREKEQQLRKITSELRVGMSPPQVIELTGQPDKVM